MSEVNEEIKTQFQTIVEKVKNKEAITQEDAEFLVGLVGGFDMNLRIANSVLQVALGSAEEAIRETAGAVLRKCGRTDTKIRRKVGTLCEDNFRSLLNVVKLYSHQAYDELNNPKEETNVYQNDSSNHTDSN